MANLPLSRAAQLEAIYADADRRLWVALQSHLVRLRENGVIIGWQDHEIQMQDVNQTDCHLGTAGVILVFVSADFLSSNYSCRPVFEQAMLRHRAGNSLVLPIIVNPVDASEADFNELTPLPRNGRPISEWDNQDEALADVASGIQQAITEFDNRRRQDSSSGEPATYHADDDFSQPPRIGRYRVLGVLGEGAFGKVFLAHDDGLDRRVAIKVPRPQRVADTSDIDAYIAEARLVAKLDHPGLVPVYDFGRTDNGLCYVVSKFIEGQDLAERLRTQGRISYRESARLIASTAEALQHAHDHDIYHRDIKPANILIDDEGKPYLADFGLAIRDEDFGTGSKFAGTPPYMSPEQARGEGHRIDGRSDIFSLGVVFYQLLTGRRPFRSKNVQSLLAEIKDTDARPPRQIDTSIPKEIERICLKAMSNLAKDRYTTARDFADDIYHFLEHHRHGSDAPSSDLLTSDDVPSTRELRDRPSHGSAASGSKGSATTIARSTVVEGAPIRIIPKGLRSFDREDADFFLDLLPGPRDRNGLPESIHFWKRHIDPSDEPTFPVGLIYGPSGCGKTSFLRAGLLPRLSSSVVVVSVEAVCGTTSAILKRKLDRRFPSLAHLEMPQMVAAVRRGQDDDAVGKLLIVIDQFEQWWQGREEREETVLLDALRQCDGHRTQCILMTRVDYLMGIHDFMEQLEVPIREGVNSAAVDLFDVKHARKVLAKFGAAYGCLPEAGELSDSNEAFIDQAVEQLSDGGKVVPVQLAVFAEMTKGKPWVSETLREIGGAQGVGVNFLEETFCSKTAPLGHRIHQQAAKSVLQSLLPGPGQNIRGAGRSRQELLDSSGYQTRPRDFVALIDILDRDLRLITPTEGTSMSVDGSADGGTPLVEADFQLTHDYLVPSLREWLSRKKKETARGRAELQLEERTALWDVRRQNRHLPSLLEFLKIHFWTRRTEWSGTQRAMMSHAAKYFAIRMSLLIVSLAVLGGYLSSLRARTLVERLAEADVSAMPELTRRIGQLSYFARRHLELLENSSASKGACLASVALLGIDRQADTFQARLTRIDDYLVKLDTSPADIALIARQTNPIRNGRRLDDLWAKLQGGAAEQRLRAACALAIYDPRGDRWTSSIREDIADQLVALPPDTLDQWIHGVMPIRHLMLPPLESVYRDGDRDETERTMACRVLAEFGPDKDILYWIELLVDATNRNQLDVCLSKLLGSEHHAAVELEKRLVDILAKRDQLAKKLDEGRSQLNQMDDLWVKLDTLKLALEATSAWQQTNQPGDDQRRGWAQLFGNPRVHDSVEYHQMQQQLAKLGRLLGDDEITEREAAKLLQLFKEELLTIESRVDLRPPDGGVSDSADDSLIDEVSQALRRLLNVAEWKKAELLRTSQAKFNLETSVVNLAIGRLRLGHSEEVWATLRHSPDPELRSRMVLAFASLGVNPRVVVRRLLDESARLDDSERIALLFALGRYDWRRISNDSNIPLGLVMERLGEWYRNADSGTHGAVRWLLSEWRQMTVLDQFDQQVAEGARVIEGQRNWYATTQGHTMVIVREPTECLAGSPSDEVGREAGPLVPFEKQHRVRIPRGFAISSTEVTHEQYRRFASHATVISHSDLQNSVQCPANWVDWYDAAAYCNWLSEVEGIPPEQWCYPREITSGSELRLPKDALQRTGYRLPTEAEWEYTCRAGTTTSRYFGDAVRLMTSYAWCDVGSATLSHTRPVGRLMPNDWGLFDMLGNVSEWCHNAAAEYDERTVSTPTLDQSHERRVHPDQLRAIRGGAFQYAAALVRSAGRDRSRPDYPYYSIGFRVARTISPDIEEHAGP